MLYLIIQHSSAIQYLCFLFLLILPPPLSTLFPYTTLFRSLCRPAASSRDGVSGRELDLCREHPRISPDSCGIHGHTRIPQDGLRSEEHTSELQSRSDLVCRLLLEKKKNIN